MALSAGGLSGALKTQLESILGEAGDLEGDRENICDAFAIAIIDYIKANAVVTVTITTSTAGLQRDSTGAATTAPASLKTLTGALS